MKRLEHLFCLISSDFASFSVIKFRCPWYVFCCWFPMMGRWWENSSGKRRGNIGFTDWNPTVARLTGVPRDLFRIAAGALLRPFPFWRSHSSCLVLVLKGITASSDFPTPFGAPRHGARTEEMPPEQTLTHKIPSGNPLWSRWRSSYVAFSAKADCNDSPSSTPVLETPPAPQ